MNKEQLKQAVAERAMNAGIHLPGKLYSAYADLVMEVIEPNHLSLDLFNAFLPTRQMNPGDQIGKRAIRGRYPIRTMVPGSKHLHDQLSFQEQLVYVFDRLIAGVSWNLWEIQSGEVGTTEKFAADLRADLFDALVSRVFSLLTTVWNSTDTPLNFTDASSTGLTAAALDAMIENVLAYAGSVRAIVGTRTALSPLYTFSLFREFVLTGTGTDRGFGITDAFNEFTRTNRVTSYKGIPVVELPQVYRNRIMLNGANQNINLRDATQRMIDTTKVLVVGDDAGEVALMGGFETQDYTDFTTQPANYVLHGWQAYGLIITDAQRLGVIKVA